MNNNEKRMEVFQTLNTYCVKQELLKFVILPRLPMELNGMLPCNEADPSVYPEVLKMYDAPPGEDAVGPLGGGGGCKLIVSATCLFE
jgi:hypothetical protein